MIKFNEHIKQIQISECVVLANSYSKEYVALHKDVFLALKEGLQTDCASLENLVTFMIYKLYKKEDQNEEAVTQIKNTIYYLVDNKYIDTSDTVCFDVIFSEISQSFVDINFMEIPAFTDVNDLHTIVAEEIKPYLFCNMITCFNLDVTNDKIIGSLASLGSILNVCSLDIGILERYVRDADFINTSQIDKLIFIISPEQYERLINLLMNVEISKDIRNKLVLAPIIDWSSMETTKEIYAMLFFMGFDVIFCPETLHSNYIWPDNANYVKMFILYSELIELCADFGIADSKLNNMLCWPLNRFSDNVKNDVKEYKGIVYFTSNNVSRLNTPKRLALAERCQECEIQGFCNAPKEVKGSCSVIKDFITYRLTNWDDDLSLRDNLNKFISIREARGV